MAEQEGGEVMAKTGRKYETDRKRVHKTTLAVAVSPYEKEQIEQDAAKMGMSMSAYVRYKLFFENK
jgi:hypothetical protein